MKHFATQLILSLVLFSGVYAQHPLRLNFVFMNDNQPIEMNTPMQDASGRTYLAQDIAFYFFDLEITHDGGQVLDLRDSVFYVSDEDHILDLGSYNIGTVELVEFAVGVPSDLNHSDISAYPDNHPLSYHVPPMHWGWSSGYVFFLFDGLGDPDNDGNPTEVFQLHSLGDQLVKLVYSENTATVHEDNSQEIIQLVNIDQWIRNINPGTTGAQHGTMGVNTTAMNNINNYPVFTAPQNAGVKELSQYTGKIRFSNENDALHLFWEEVKEASSFGLIDMNGKTVANGTAASANGDFRFEQLQAGTYLFCMRDKQGKVLNQITVAQP